MKKYLIFAMLLLAVLACKPKQKPSGTSGSTGGGGYIKPPTITSEDAGKVLDTFKSIVTFNDEKGKTDPTVWQKSDWAKTKTLTGADIGQITNGGFFVANYAKDTWIVFAVNHDRNVYVGMEEGIGKLEDALALLVDTKTRKLRDESWDPRKFVYNYDEDAGELRIAWLGRALGKINPGHKIDMRFRSYDAQYPNALKFLTGEAKTYAALRNYLSEEIEGNMPQEFKDGPDWVHAGGRWAPHEEPKDPSDTDQRRKIWDQAGLFTSGIGPEVFFYQSANPNSKDHAVWLVSRKMRFGYTAGRESGFLSGIGTPGNKATPKDATLAEKQAGGKYYDGYDTSNPRGKTIFRRPLPPKTDTQGGVITDVRFLTTVVAYNIKMRPAQDQNTRDLFGGEYDVKDVIFEFDAGSFADVTADKFSENELPIRQNVPPTDEIKDGSDIKTYKIPLLYFSPK